MHLKQFTVQGEHHISSHVIPESVDYLRHIRVGFDSLQSVTVIQHTHMKIGKIYTIGQYSTVLTYKIIHLLKSPVTIPVIFSKKKKEQSEHCSLAEPDSIMWITELPNSSLLKNFCNFKLVFLHEKADAYH